jgi:hypothetical protein
VHPVQGLTRPVFAAQSDCGWPGRAEASEAGALLLMR